MIIPEQDLWIAVCCQAIVDYQSEPAGRRIQGGMNLSRPEWEEARAFCLDESGEWAEQRAITCHLAGIDPDAFREFCLGLDPRGNTGPTKSWSSVNRTIVKLAEMEGMKRGAKRRSTCKR